MLFQRKSLSSHQVRIIFQKQFYCIFWFFFKKVLSIYPKLILDIYPYTLHRYPAVCLHLFWWLFYVFWRCTWGTLNEGDEIVSISSKLVRRMTRVDCVKALKGKTKCHLPCSSHLFWPVYFSFSLSDIYKTVHISFLDRHI